MKVVIAGQGKSGTTALFYKLRDAFPAAALTLLEPTEYSETGTPDVLAKVLIDPPGRVDFASFERFDRKILLVRDPRDNLLSRVLYRTYNRAAFVSDPRAVGRFIATLEEKEADPATVSLLELIRCFDDITGIDSLPRLKGHPATGLAFAAAHADYHVIRYEELVDGQLESLCHYLGFEIDTGPAAIPADHQRVNRTGTYGQWRQWFTPEDVAEFRPAFQDYLLTYRYDSDWRLTPPATLDGDTGSRYVLRLVNERRAELDLPALCRRDGGIGVTEASA